MKGNYPDNWHDIADERAAEIIRCRAINADLLKALTEYVERQEAEGNVKGLPEYEQARAAIKETDHVLSRDLDQREAALARHAEWRVD